MKNLSNVGLLMRTALILAGTLAGSFILFGQPAAAATDESGAVGIQATIPSPPPSRGATIAVPSNGAVFTSVPITVSGICPTGLLVKVFANNIFVGSVVCANGSYSLQVDLFSGQNDLVARDYDALDQAGPDSSTVSVNFSDAQFTQFGSQLTLSSAYAERGATPGQTLDWPILMNGGTGPYAISIDWGDGSTSLQSASTAGTINLSHTYNTAGIYKIIVKATDKNGNEAFLQLVGQATGAIQSSSKPSGGTIVKTKVLWWPTLVTFPLIISTFWLGRRHELRSLQEGIEKSRGA